MAHIAVVDVETTGLSPYRSDRIVELAVVVIDESGTVIRELTTLVNPERDVGPSHIHGVTARDVFDAPRFGDVAGILLDTLRGCVAVAGHNVRFDLSFLAAEFMRIGYQFPECPSLCTMRMAGGGNLVRVCSEYGIAFDGAAHSALHDARATARLLTVLLRQAPGVLQSLGSLPPIDWGHVPHSPAQLITREEARRRQSEAAACLDMPTVQSPKELVGKRVCFTGESHCRVNGVVISRRMAEELATRYGMVVVQSVTRQVDVLVAADPFTQSGKAQKARKYGIPIMAESMFWRILGLDVG